MDQRPCQIGGGSSRGPWRIGGRGGVRGRAGALCGGDIRRRLTATVAVLAGCWGAGRTWAQPENPASPTPPAGSENRPADLPGSLDPLGPEDAMACFALAETWVRGWTEPASADVPPLLGAKVRGASVILRHAGKIVGRGSAITLGGAGQGENPLAIAAREAWKEATDRMPGDKDAFREERLHGMAGQVAVSVEVCGEPTVITPLAFDEVDRTLAPGLDGVAVRIGARVVPMFPEAMLIRGISTGDAMASCIGQAADNPELGIRTNPLTQPPAITKTHQAVFYRFRPLHVAQAGVGGAGRFLHRGGRIIESREIAVASLREWAQHLAEHLVGRTTTEEADITDPPHPDAKGRICLRMGGTMWPLNGHMDTPVAMPEQQLVAAMALRRYGRCAGAPAEVGRRCRNTAVRLLRDVLQHVPVTAPTVETDTEEVVRYLAFQDILPDLITEQKFAPWHRNVTGLDISKWDPAIKVRHLRSLDAGAPIEKLTVQTRAMLALGLAVSADEQAEPHTRALLRTLGIAELSAGMPWIGWAELGVAMSKKVPPSAAMLRDWREAACARMVPAQAPGSDDADLAGGLAEGPYGRPTADTARAIAFLGTMLRDPGLTDAAERPKELSRLLAGLRFLRQLSVDDYSGYGAEDPEKAMWGIRRSIWDQQLDPADTGMALIAVSEALDAITQMQKGIKPPTPPAPATTPSPATPTVPASSGKPDIR